MVSEKWRLWKLKRHEDQARAEEGEPEDRVMVFYETNLVFCPWPVRPTHGVDRGPICIQGYPQWRSEVFQYTSEQKRVHIAMYGRVPFAKEAPHPATWQTENYQPHTL